jgi:hypothetical protein
MGCERFEAELIAVAAGAAPSARVQAHLEDCLSCRRWLQEQQSLLDDVDRALKARLRVEPSPRVAARVVSRLAEARARASWPPPAAAALAAGLGAALLAGWIARRPPAEPPSEARLATRSTPRGPRDPAPTPSPAAHPTGVAPVDARPRGAVHIARTAAQRRPGTVRARAGSEEPVVLVPPGQEELLRRFVAGLRTGTRPAPPLLVASASVESPVAPPPLLEIPPLDAEPLDEAADPPKGSDS